MPAVQQQSAGWAKAVPTPAPEIKPETTPPIVKSEEPKKVTRIEPGSVTPAPKQIEKTRSKIKPGKRPARSSDAPGPAVTIPPLLLEGDLPPGPAVSGPGARYALAPQPVALTVAGSSGELPEAYGTGRVFLAARDPHWLYVSWDFTSDQQKQFNTQSRDGHLIIRIFVSAEQTTIVPEMHVHPESKHWFVHVPLAETSYRAELGFYEVNGAWRSASVSHDSFTPPEAPSTDVTAEFATIPVEVTFQQIVEAVQQFVSVSKNEPLLEAVALASEAQREGEISERAPNREPEQSPIAQTSATAIRRANRRRRPLPIEITQGNDWSSEQSGALKKLIHIDSYRRVWLGSMEITELVRRQLEEEISSIAAAEAKRAARGDQIPFLVGGISSPPGGEFQKPGKFWFKVNAELIIYGATEPDAKVTIADRLIKLRPDGTFSFRFSLPDGRYQLPAVALSSDGAEGREARLEFSRSTNYRGQVEAHPQDAALRPPHAEHL